MNSVYGVHTPERLRSWGKAQYFCTIPGYVSSQHSSVFVRAPSGDSLLDFPIVGFFSDDDQKLRNTPGDLFCRNPSTSSGQKQKLWYTMCTSFWWYTKCTSFCRSLPKAGEAQTLVHIVYQRFCLPKKVLEIPKQNLMGIPKFKYPGYQVPGYLVPCS